MLGKAFKMVGIAAVVFAQGSAWAVTLPGSTQPGQISQSLTPRRQQQEILPPVVTETDQKPAPANEQAKKLKFNLKKIILQDNTVYSSAHLSKLFKDQLNRTITVAKLFDIVKSLTNYYRNNGYIISRAVLPPQHVKNGVVKIKIVEGYIDKVKVAGNPYGSQCLVHAYGVQATKCKPLHISRMESYLLFANDIPGTRVKAVLAPSKRHVGAADMTLVTESRRASGYISYDNYGTRYIGPLQLTASGTLYSFAASGDSLSVTLTKATKGSQLTFWDLRYDMPIGDHGIRWSVGATRSQTHPGFVLRSSKVDGVNENYYTTATFPVKRTRSETMNITAGFNWLDSDVDSLNSTLYDDHIRSIDFGWMYNFADKHSGTNFLAANLRNGISALGYSSDLLTASTSRPGGRADYTKITAQASRVQAIKGPLSLYGVVKGQYSFNPLLSSEQFAFGGSDLGRGYDVAEILGDRGAAGSLEVRFNMTPSTWLLKSLQLYSFYDYGVIWNKADNGGILTKESASSAGAGLRFFVTDHLNGNFMWTQAITRKVAAEEIIGNGSHPRVFFSISATA